MVRRASARNTRKTMNSSRVYQKSIRTTLCFKVGVEVASELRQRRRSGGGGRRGGEEGEGGITRLEYVGNGIDVQLGGGPNTSSSG